MPSIADPRALDRLLRRLDGLTPDTPRRWGTLTAHEMLCHLADACTGILARPGGPAAPPRLLRRWLALHTPMPWPRGLPTPSRVDPHKGGTRPDHFERDRARALAGLRALPAAPDAAFPASHAAFGGMRAVDWRCWGYRHTDHHLRQFGL